MKTLDMQELLKQYKIDVEFIEEFLDNDDVEIEELFYRRGEILKNFDDLTWKQLKEFLNSEKTLDRFLNEIRKRYPRLYEKVVEPQNKQLKLRLIDIFITS